MTLGLTTSAARHRLAELGRNEIVRDEPNPPWRMFAAQFRSPLIWLLLGAALASGLLGEASDAFAIVVIVVINALVGFAADALVLEAHALSTNEAALTGESLAGRRRMSILRADGVLYVKGAIEAITELSPGALASATQPLARWPNAVCGCSQSQSEAGPRRNIRNFAFLVSSA